MIARLIAAALAAWLAVAAGTGRADPAAPAAPASMSAAPARLDDDGRVKMPPMVIRAAPPDRDLRPVYVGAALVVLAAGLWWNRQQRDRFEREDARPVRRPRGERRPRAADRDDELDGDELRAAARATADAPDPPDRPAPPTANDRNDA